MGKILGWLTSSLWNLWNVDLFLEVAPIKSNVFLGLDRKEVSFSFIRVPYLVTVGQGEMGRAQVHRQIHDFCAKDEIVSQKYLGKCGLGNTSSFPAMNSEKLLKVAITKLRLNP